MTFKDYLTENKFKTGDKITLKTSTKEVYRLKLKEKKGENWDVEYLSTGCQDKRDFSIEFIEKYGEK